MHPPPSDDASQGRDPCPLEQVSHHLLLLFDPFRATETKRATLRWLAGLTPGFLRDLAADPEWETVRAALTRAADRWLDRVEAEEDAEEREPWQAPAVPATARPAVGTGLDAADGEVGERPRRAVPPQTPGAAPAIALHVASIRELLIDDYDARPHVLPFENRYGGIVITDGLPDVNDVRAGIIATAAARQHAVIPDERYAALLPWCVTNHATWLVALADRVPDRPAVWRRFLHECLARPGIARAVPTRLARVAVAVCEGHSDRWGLLDRVIAAVESALAALPPIEVVPAEALPDVVVAVRAPVAQVIRTAEATEPRLVCLAELLGLVRLLRHASALDVRAAYHRGRREPEGALRAMRELTDAAELQFERVFTATLQQPPFARLLAVGGRGGAEALSYTRRRYDEWRARTGELGIIPSDERAL